MYVLCTCLRLIWQMFVYVSNGRGNIGKITCHYSHFYLFFVNATSVSEQQAFYRCTSVYFSSVLFVNSHASIIALLLICRISSNCYFTKIKVEDTEKIKILKRVNIYLLILFCFFLLSFRLSTTTVYSVSRRKAETRR